MSQVVEAVAENLMLDVKNVFSKHKKLTPELLKILHFVFQKSLFGALNIIDKGFIHKYITSNGRSVYQIKGNNGRTYECFSSGLFCTCQSFQFSVLKKAEIIMCKHILSVHLTEAMDNASTSLVSDEVMTSMIASTSLEFF